MKPIKAWAVLAGDQLDPAAGLFDRHGIFRYRKTAERVAMPGSRVVRVEVREVPKKKARESACDQCGQSIWSWACGPTHAAMQMAKVAKPKHLTPDVAAVYEAERKVEAAQKKART